MAGLFIVIGYPWFLPNLVRSPLPMAFSSRRRWLGRQAPLPEVVLLPPGGFREVPLVAGAAGALPPRGNHRSSVASSVLPPLSARARCTTCIPASSLPEADSPGYGGRASKEPALPALLQGVVFLPSSPDKLPLGRGHAGSCLSEAQGAPTAGQQQAARCARVLATSVNVADWARVVREVDAVVAGCKAPEQDVRVVAHTLDAFKRLFAALPSHRHLVEGPLAYLETAVFSRRTSDPGTIEQRCDASAETGAYASSQGTDGSAATEPVSMLARYACFEPYFELVPRLRLQVAECQEQLRWMWSICTCGKNQQNITYRIFGGASELTSGSILNWCFAYWRLLAAASRTLCEQIDFICLALKPNCLVVNLFLLWSSDVCRLNTARVRIDSENRKAELESMRERRISLVRQIEQLDSDIEYSGENCTRLDSKLVQIGGDSKALQARLDEYVPELLKATLVNMLILLCTLIVTSTGLDWVQCKTTFINKDLSTFTTFAESDSMRKVGLLSCEDLLVRWLNFLLLQAKTCAVDLLDLASKDHVSDARGAWPTRYASVYGWRCRQVRAAGLIDCLQDAGESSVILCALCAMIKSLRRRQRAFDPADLWPLDEKDPKARAAVICRCLHGLVPTLSARRLLTASDIQSGNRLPLMKFLSVLFVREAPGLDDRDTQSGGRRLRPYLEAQGDMLATLEKMAGATTYAHLDDPWQLLAQGEDQDVTRLLSLRVEDLLLRWVNLHTATLGGVKCLGGDLRNGSMLLHLLGKVAPDALEVCGIVPKNLKADDEIVQAVLDCGARCAQPFCLSAEALRSGCEDAIACFVGGVFLVQPAIPPQAGSTLWVQVRMLEKVASEGCFMTTVCDLDEADTRLQAGEELEVLWRTIEEQHEALRIAVSAVETARDTMEQIRSRVHTFIMESCSRPSHGLASERESKTSTTVKECMRMSRWASLLKAEPVCLRAQRVRQIVQTHARLLEDIFKWYSLDSSDGDRRMPLEGIMRIYKDCHLQCPCVCTPQHVAHALFYRVLEDDLAPSEMKSDEDYEIPIEGLSRLGFVRWFLRLGLQRYEMVTQRTETVEDLRQSLVCLIECHFSPYACPHSVDEFSKLSKETEIRTTFVRRENILRASFEFYASEVGDIDVEDVSNITVQHALKVDSFAQLLEDSGNLKGLLTRDTVRSIFNSILTRSRNADVFDPCPLAHKPEHMERRKAGTYSAFDLRAQVKGIVRGRSVQVVKTSKTEDQAHRNSSKTSSSNNCDEGVKDGLSFYDFLDGLLAAALYSNPNPLVPPGVRLAHFLRQLLLPGLSAHMLMLQFPVRKGREALKRLEMLRRSLIDDRRGEEEMRNTRRERWRLYNARDSPSTCLSGAMGNVPQETRRRSVV